MSDASFNKFRARIAELRGQLERGTARPTLAPRVAPFKSSAPTGGGGAPANTPAKPPDAPGTGEHLPPVAGGASAAPFFIVPKSGAPSVTLPLKQLKADAKLERKKLGPKEAPLEVQRPKTRGDCFGGPRPCPHVSCRYHTYLEVTAAGSLVINRPDVDVTELRASCALDIADAGPVTLEQVGDVLNVTRERVRQVESTAFAHAQKAFAGGEVKQFRGSCKAVCAMSGRRCQLPAHNDTVKHHDGRKAFHLVALPDQTTFVERERLERVATANVGEAVHERG